MFNFGSFESRQCLMYWSVSFRRASAASKSSYTEPPFSSISVTILSLAMDHDFSTVWSHAVQMMTMVEEVSFTIIPGEELLFVR